MNTFFKIFIIKILFNWNVLVNKISHIYRSNRVIFFFKFFGNWHLLQSEWIINSIKEAIGNTRTFAISFVWLNRRRKYIMRNLSLNRAPKRKRKQILLSNERIFLIIDFIFWLFSRSSWVWKDSSPWPSSINCIIFLYLQFATDNKTCFSSLIFLLIMYKKHN